MATETSGVTMVPIPTNALQPGQEYVIKPVPVANCQQPKKKSGCCADFCEQVDNPKTRKCCMYCTWFWNCVMCVRCACCLSRML